MLKLHMVICFLTAKEKVVAEIHRELMQTYGENCIDVSNMQRWKRDFENKHCVLLDDEELSMWLMDSLTVDNIHHAHEILKAENHLTLKIAAHMPHLLGVLF